MSELKKFVVATIKATFRNKPKTHALKGSGRRKMAWCGCVFKRTQIVETKEQTIEHITCQKCINTINANLKNILT